MKVSFLFFALIAQISFNKNHVVGYMQDTCGPPVSSRLRACPNIPGLELTVGMAGACPVGMPLKGECIADEDCMLKQKGNVCCYNRCRGMTECHRFP